MKQCFYSEGIIKAIDVIGKCENPYCKFPDAKMRSPTEEELRLWESQASDEVRNQFNKGGVTLLICEGCGVWTAEMWNEEKQKTIRGCVPSPFRFNVGDRLKVILEGNSFCKIGTVIRRDRLVKALYPSPVPENYYSILLEKNKNESRFREDHLESINH